VNTPCNLSYFEVEIDKNGKLVKQSQPKAVIDFLTAQKGAIKNLFVMSHGWNNDEDEARSLYREFFTNVCDVLARYAAMGVAPGQCAVVGFLWPSKKFADSDLIPGGAAALGDQNAPLQAGLDQLAGALGSDAAPQIAQARQQLDALEDSPDSQRKFVDALRSLLPNAPDREDGLHLLFDSSGDELLQQLSAPLPPLSRPADPEEGGAAAIGAIDTSEQEGGALGFGSFLQGIKRGAMQLLNLTTYYVMKDRSGIVGRGAAAGILQQIRDAFPDIRVHLIGHSFGCRLLTSAAATITKPVASMTLFQAAFSHNSFSPDFDQTHQPGGFRNVITQAKVSGPIVISHTVKDLAVGLAYAMASRLARQNASAIGDENDPYGGLGRNGAQHTPEASNMDIHNAGVTYSLQAGKIANLKADTVILGHSDIKKPETAYAMMAAAGLVK
jgi:hypothetical protein